ncbi:TonB-dependent siderophore receptor [Marinobacter sp. 1Y8]
MNRSDNNSQAFRISMLAALVAGVLPLHAMAQDDEAVELDEIVVSDDRQGPVGPDYGYNAERSLTATKTDTPLSETPRSVSVVTRNQIEDQNSRTLSDILGYVPGISAPSFPVGDSLAGDIFYIRGMNQRDYGYGTYRDGLRMQSNAYATSAEPYGLERVEVFKGPTSVLYGENVPGGLVNLVSKRPTETPQGEVNLSYGTHSRAEGSVDVSGPLTESGNVLGRLVFLGRDADTQTENVEDDRIFIAPSLTFKLTDQDTLTLLSMYQRDKTEIQLGLPAAGTLLDHPSGQKQDLDASLGHPTWDTFDREFWTLGYEYEHRFNSGWAFNQNARYMKSKIQRNEVWWSFPPAGFGGAAGDGYDPFVVAYGRDRENESTAFSIDNRLVGKFRTGDLDNTVLVGASFDKTSFDQVQYVSSRAPNEYTPLDVFDPQWPGEPQTSNLSSDDDTKQDLAGIYTQWQGKVGGLIGLIGGRYDWAKSEVDNRLAGGNDISTEDDDFSWQTGLMYQFDSGISPYLSYATSFVPVQQLQNPGQAPFDPITGDQYEAGIKYEPIGWNTTATVAAYRINKDGDLFYDSTIGGYRQIGESVSRGAEVEVRSDLTESLSMVASYTYTDAEITEDGGSRYEGNQVVGVPRHQASLWANYEFFGDMLNGLETGVGARYLGSSYAYPSPTLAYGTLKTKNVTLFDFAIGYAMNENWRVQGNVQNLFDKQYVAECNNAGRCYWGSERTVQGTLTYNW